ncbi:hypothetical protein AMES_2104 [Amycolatopsis mediterranei S699]|uniref:Uncharacterized protein n=2 Tax=Amycolatopsis mediterranei TaxID=33910 RepID=A0A0H3CZ64_AMYMU|nr:hypothetical protein [Amycolatopsis mediterranei]ADJ43927.1 hypothetical protein AMED_2122 [Amycolatopsis mediterranei U32]AEK40648.1 hypothetical protein RAM_10790 [Amycolatopsis mediterranei S699]AFO75640.1 hypothetical protein AMES_2104 [Amycolatopsis mediterranei S699]AGT82769.1 hypothetical protein B737_2105 [Amycolatopsis mediterranei RB]KDO04278.1 hypothetical protein DV26_44840 [Amycolatopsis mediterranei]
MPTNTLLILGRTLTVLGGLVLLGVVVRLSVAVLEATLPPVLMNGLAAGFATLVSILNPAMGSLMALFIIVGLCYIALGRRR